MSRSSAVRARRGYIRQVIMARHDAMDIREDAEAEGGVRYVFLMRFSPASIGRGCDSDTDLKRLALHVLFTRAYTTAFQ